MRREAVDKPRYSFNFRVGKKRKEREEGKKGKRGLIKKGQTQSGVLGGCWRIGVGWGGGIIHANERTVALKSSFVNLSSPTFPPHKGKKFFISPHCRGLMFKELPCKCLVTVFPPKCFYVSTIAKKNFDRRVSIVTGDVRQSLYRGDINI